MTHILKCDTTLFMKSDMTRSSTHNSHFQLHDFFKKNQKVWVMSWHYSIQYTFPKMWRDSHSAPTKKRKCVLSKMEVHMKTSHFQKCVTCLTQRSHILFFLGGHVYYQNGGTHSGRGKSVIWMIRRKDVETQYYIEGWMWKLTTIITDFPRQRWGPPIW